MLIIKSQLYYPLIHWIASCMLDLGPGQYPYELRHEILRKLNNSISRTFKNRLCLLDVCPVCLESYAVTILLASCHDCCTLSSETLFLKFAFLSKSLKKLYYCVVF